MSDRDQTRGRRLARQTRAASLTTLGLGLVVAFLLALPGAGGRVDRETDRPTDGAAVAAAPTAGADTRPLLDSGMRAPSNDRLREQSLARSVTFGDAAEDADGALTPWEEAAFEAALDSEASAAIRPSNLALALLERARTRPVQFGDRELTEEQSEFVESQEWWALQVEATGTTATW